MEKFNATATKDVAGKQVPVVREYAIGGKNYIVKSYFVGEKDVKTVLFNLAAKKAAKEMGLDYIST